MRLYRLGCALAAVGLLAGCGGKGDASRSAKATATATASAAAATPAPTQTPTSTPAKDAKPSPTPFTSAGDLANCAPLEQAVQAVSALVGHTTEGITQAQHPEELADKMGTAQHSLLDSAKLIRLVDPPDQLVSSQHQFEQGLTMFAADFARAQASAKAGDLNKAAAQTIDAKALRKLQVAAKRIDDMCGD